MSVKSPEINPNLVTLPDSRRAAARPRHALAWFGNLDSGTFCGPDFADDRRRRRRHDHHERPAGQHRRATTRASRSRPRSRRLLRVPARRWRLHAVRLAADLHGARERDPYVRGAGDRLQREHRSHAGHLHLDDPGGHARRPAETPIRGRRERRPGLGHRPGRHPGSGRRAPRGSAHASQKGITFVPLSEARRSRLARSSTRARARFACRARRTARASVRPARSSGRLPGAPVEEAEREGPHRPDLEGLQLPALPRAGRQAATAALSRRHDQAPARERQGTLPHQRAQQLGDRTRHRLGRDGPLRRHAHEGPPRNAWSCATSGARRTSSSTAARATWPARRARPAERPSAARLKGEPSSSPAARRANVAQRALDGCLCPSDVRPDGVIRARVPALRGEAEPLVGGRGPRKRSAQ